jgi:hypothetical protein
VVAHTKRIPYERGGVRFVFRAKAPLRIRNTHFEKVRWKRSIGAAGSDAVEMEQGLLSGKGTGFIAFCRACLAFEGSEHFMPMDRDVAGSSDTHLYVAVPDAKYGDLDFIPDYEAFFFLPCEYQHLVVLSWTGIAILFRFEAAGSLVVESFSASPPIGITGLRSARHPG